MGFSAGIARLPATALAASLPGAAPTAADRPTPPDIPSAPATRGRAQLVRTGGERLLTLAAGLAAAIPVIAATVRAIAAGWVPVADRGIIATRAHDVFSSHPPLVGQYTLAGEVTGRVTHSLGPMLFWLLAPAAYHGSDVGMTVTMGALNTACIVGCVALARQRGGRVLMVVTAVAIALACQSLASETFHDVWNPSAGLWPFTLSIFLWWSVACGAYRLLPLAVLTSSFAVQAHFTYLPPTLALLAVGFGGLALGALAQRRRGADPPGEHGAPGAETPRRAGVRGVLARRAAGVRGVLARRRAALGWTVATVAIAAACWSATVAGQLTEHPGNLTLVAQAATRHEATLGATVGWHAVVHAVGVVPWWLQTPASRWQRKYEVRATPSARAVRSTIVWLAALVVVAAVALARRRRDVATLALTALALCPALAAVAADTPTPRRLSATLGYTLWWGSQAGMVVWLALAWALGVAAAWAARKLARGRVRHAPGRLAALGGVALTLVGVGVAAAVGVAVAAQGTPDEHQVTYKPIKTIDARLARLTPRGGTVLLEGELDGAEMPIKPAVRYFLVTRGTRVLAPGSALRLGTWYELYDRPYREALYLSDVPRPPVRHVPLAFSVSFREGRTVNTVYVWRSRRPGR